MPKGAFCAGTTKNIKSTTPYPLDVVDSDKMTQKTRALTILVGALEIFY